MTFLRKGNDRNHFKYLNTVKPVLSDHIKQDIFF